MNRKKIKDYAPNDLKKIILPKVLKNINSNFELYKKSFRNKFNDYLYSEIQAGATLAQKLQYIVDFNEFIEKSKEFFEKTNGNFRLNLIFESLPRNLWVQHLQLKCKNINKC